VSDKDEKTEQADRSDEARRAAKTKTKAKTTKPHGTDLVPLTAEGAAWQVAKLELLRARRGKALIAAAGVALLLVVVATVACIAGSGDSRATFLGTVRSLFPWLSMGLALLFAARTVADDVESGVLYYFHLLPVRRWSVTLGKYLCAAMISTGILVSSTVLLYIGTHLAEPELLLTDHMDLWRSCATVLAAGLCYTALFLFLGSAVTDLPYLLPLLFVAIFEVGLGSLPVVEVVSIRHHVNVLLGSGAQASADGMVDNVLQLIGLVTPTVPPWVAAVVLAAVFAICLGLALLVTEISEYKTGRA
jgi:ABC-type transport system involved in multi-copper enzyme maturation permease subunit